MQLLLKPDFLNFSHVMRTNQSKFSKFGRWKFIDHRFFFLFFRGIPLEETSSHDSMTKLFTSLHKVSSKAYFGKVFKRGLDEQLASSRTKKPLISWFNEHGHPAHHHSFFFCSRLLREWENDLFPSLQTHIVNESAVF